MLYSSKQVSMLLSHHTSELILFIVSKLQSLRLVELVQNDQTLNTIKGTVIRCCNSNIWDVLVMYVSQ
jgi:hypothetical protein